VTTDLPIAAEYGCALFNYPERRPEVNTACIPSAVISPGFFTTLGIDIEGRDLTWGDLDSKTGAAALTGPLAARAWQGERALDRGINGPNNTDAPPYRVVAVTRGLRWRGLDQPPTEVAFFPIEPIPKTWLWYPPARVYLVAKVTRPDPTAVVPDLLRIVRQLDPEVAVERPRPMAEILAGSLSRVRLLMVLLGVSAGAALFLSVIGLYGAVAYSVSRRTREIGLRMAIGAPAEEVRNQVVAQAVRLAILGVLLGLGGALATGRLLSALLFNVSPSDPPVLAGVALTLIVVSVLASFRPASTAAAVDPVAALRGE
jgi:hypothetical protein